MSEAARRAAGTAQNARIGAQEGRSGLRGAKTTTEAPTASVGPLRAVWASMSEREFQRIVVDGLRRRGWLVFVVPDMRKTLAGLPDLLCIHAGRDVLLAWELKRETGKPTPIQRGVLAILDGIPGVDARIVRPSDWPALSEEV